MEHPALFKFRQQALKRSSTCALQGGQTSTETSDCTASFPTRVLLCIASRITFLQPPQLEQLVRLCTAPAEPLPQTRTKAAECHPPSPQPQEKSDRESSSLLPMLSTPRGMITSAYFFVCKTGTVVETVNGKGWLGSRKKPPNTRKLGAKMEGFLCSGTANQNSLSW